MKKFRDLIYDYNDVFVALVIVAVAAVVLAWRINVVMSYPDGVTFTAKEEEEYDIDFSDIDLNPESLDQIKDIDDDGSSSGEDTSQENVQSGDQTIVPGDAESETDAEKEAENGAEKEAEDEPEKEAEPTVNTYTIEVSRKNKNANWTSIGKELEANGILATGSALGKKAKEMGKDGSLQVGTFELSSDMTLEEMVKILITVPR